MSDTATLSLTGTNIVTYNVAGGDGGGIFMPNLANTQAIRDRLTISNTTSFDNNSAVVEERMPTAMGILQFPQINWQGQNTLNGMRSATPPTPPHADPHLLNNYDVFWEHPFHQVTVRLEVVDGRSPVVGVGSPVTTLNVPGGTPLPTLITVNGVGNGERVIPTADIPSTPVLQLTGINPNWFTVTVTRYDGTTPTTIPGSFNNTNLGNAAVWIPTTPAQLAITASGQNVTFRVSISALTGPMMTISTPIDYGAHLINVTGPETITLASAHSGGAVGALDPASVVFNVFHDNTGGMGWTLNVRAQAPTTGPFAGNNQLSSRMHM